MADRYILEQALRQEEEFQRYYQAYSKKASTQELQEFFNRCYLEGLGRIKFLREELRKMARG